MKNATKHADTLRSLFRSLMREVKPEPLAKLDPLRALVRGAMSFDVSDSKADDAMKIIDREFVHLNELRVATELEAQAILGSRYPDIERRVTMLTRALNVIFEKEHTLSLDRLKTISRRDARQYVRELPEIHPFVEAYVMLAGFEGSAVPVDSEIVAFLVGEEVLEENATLDEAQRFLENNLKAEEYQDFFVCLRKAIFSHKRKKK
jgi:hypothetical protein